MYEEVDRKLAKEPITYFNILKNLENCMLLWLISLLDKHGILLKKLQNLL